MNPLLLVILCCCEPPVDPPDGPTDCSAAPATATIVPGSPYPPFYANNTFGCEYSRSVVTEDTETFMNVYVTESEEFHQLDYTHFDYSSGLSGIELSARRPVANGVFGTYTVIDVTLYGSATVSPTTVTLG